MKEIIIICELISDLVDFLPLDFVTPGFICFKVIWCMQQSWQLDFFIIVNIKHLGEFP